MTDISVVIGTRNQRAILAFVLDSFARQTMPADRFEVVVVDSASDDGTDDLCQEGRWPYRLRYWRRRDEGKVVARNEAIREARGRLVLLTDGDVVADPALLQTHIDAHERHPGAAVVGCQFMVDGAGEIGDRRRTALRRRLRPGARLRWDELVTGNASIERQMLVDAGAFDEAFTGYGYEDYELGYRLARRRVPIVYAPEAVNWHCHAVRFEDDLQRKREAGRGAVVFTRLHPSPMLRARLGLHAPNRLLWSLVPGEGRLARAARDRAGLPGRRGRLARAFLLDHAFQDGARIARREGPVALTPRRVLVVRTDKIGDMLLTTPAVRAVRCAFPRAHLTLLASPYNAPAVADWPVPDEIALFDRRWTLRRRIAIAKAIRRRGYDLCVVLHPDLQAYLLARVSGARVRVGAVIERRVLDRVFAPALLTRRFVSRAESAARRGLSVPHEVDITRETLSLAGIPWAGDEQEVAVQPDAARWMDRVLEVCGFEPDGLVGFHLSSKWLDHQTPEQVAELIAAIAASRPGLGVVVTHGPLDEDVAARVARAARLEPAPGASDAGVVLNWSHRVAAVPVDFPRWTAALARCAAVVTRDTGSLHLASALRRPVVVVYSHDGTEIGARTFAPWQIPSRRVHEGVAADARPSIIQALHELLDTRPAAAERGAP